MTNSIENQLAKLQKSLSLTNLQMVDDTDAFLTVPNEHKSAWEVYAKCMRHNDLHDTAFTSKCTLTVCFDEDNAYMQASVLIRDTVLNRSDELLEGKVIYFDLNTPSIVKVAQKALKDLERIAVNMAL